MGILYKNNRMYRLDFGRWLSAGVFCDGRMNYFNNYSRRGLEFFCNPMVAMPRFLDRLFDWELAFFTKPERFRIAYHRTDLPTARILLTGLWFGLGFHCPRWLARRREDRWIREMEEAYDRYFAENPEAAEMDC